METTRRLAIFRINYKSDFVLTLQSDAGWNIPFCIKFWTSVPTRAYYAGWDGTTYTHCAPVAGDSSKLQVQFDNHNLPIGELKYQIGYHFTVDDFPNDPEDEVINQEAVIIDNNGRNEKVLLDFNGETAPDIQFSLPAYANEAQRIANEEQRIENEQTRISNEETRILHEWERQRNEQTRIAQEEARERAFTQMQRDSESATRDANDAATLANSKARLAQEKAEYAQQQGDFAKAQGETAQLDHTKAAADHQTALADHQTAAADHQTALADHQTAAADHQTAESDHTRAGQDHTDIQNAIAAADLVFDISKAHASGGVLATYADLSAALGTNGANVPVERRQGGMTVQFVRSSDNNYVQYRYMLPYAGNTTAENNKFVNPANWQGVDDEPTAGSNNLVKSGGIKAAIPEIVDNLTTNDSTKTLSSKQGSTLINSILNNCVKSDRLLRDNNLPNSKILADGSIVEQNYNQVAIYNITDEFRNSRILEVTGYKRSDDAVEGLLYAFYDSDDNYISNSGGGQGSYGIMTLYISDIPLNATTLKVSWYYRTEGAQSIVYDYLYSYDVAFKTGEELKEVKIDKAFEGGYGNVMSAENGKKILNALSSTVTIDKNSNTENSKILEDGSIDEQNYNQVATYNITSEIRDGIIWAITGYKRAADLNSGLLYAFYDSNNVFISGGGIGKSGVFTETLTEIPSNAAILKVSWYKRSSDVKASNVTVTNINTTSVATIHPEFERGRLDANGLIESSAYIKNQRSCNYIKVHTNSTYIINMSINCILRIYEYADNYTLIRYTDNAIIANTNFEFHNNSGTFLKFHVSITSYDDTTTLVPNFNFSIQGKFDADWNVKNVRPLSGYQHLFVTVFPMDTRATAIYPLGIDAADISLESNNVQDNSELNYDSGLLALPETYTNNGKPTRLIIYCHGAGVNYSDSVAEFPSTDLRPEYWLSEGYAVMDMDGECGSSASQQHNYAPESVQCYINAYKQVIRNYNIYTDGVFVGGRSMGGGMSIALCTTNEIPIISCCPVVPVLNNLWWWEYMAEASRIYVANKMGFNNVPDSNFPLNETGWAYLKSQFPYLVKYSPLWKCITDLPDADTLFDGLRMTSYKHDINDPTVQAEYDVFKNLHADIKCPVKIFHNYTDPTVPWERNARIFYQMLINAGNNCELRMFHAENDVDTSISAHHFELRTDRILPTYTNSFGVELENVPVVYIEMLKFWQRYELHK